jgi:hypothetical protein
VRLVLGAASYEGHIDEDGVLSLGKLGRFFDW